MTNIEHGVPVPYFRIGTDYAIHAVSAEASKLFAEARSMLELVDDESQRKFTHFVTPHQADSPAVEVQLITRQNELALFKIEQSWDEDGTGILACLPLDAQIQSVRQDMHRIREQLAKTPAPPASRHQAMKQLLLLNMQPPDNPQIRKMLRDIPLDLSAAIEGLRLVKTDLIELEKQDIAEMILRHLQEAERSFAELAQLMNKPQRPR